MILRLKVLGLNLPLTESFLSIELANFFCDTPQGNTSVLPGQYISVQPRTFEGAVRTNCYSRGAPSALYFIPDYLALTSKQV